MVNMLQSVYSTKKLYFNLKAFVLQKKNVSSRQQFLLFKVLFTDTKESDFDALNLTFFHRPNFTVE